MPIKEYLLVDRALRERLAAARTLQDVDTDRTVFEPYIDDPAAAWARADFDHRRAVLAAAIERVIVHPADSSAVVANATARRKATRNAPARHIADRVDFAWRF